jgi:ubiquinone/menaquinone biosynthesis C-methylase UbiE
MMQGVEEGNTKGVSALESLDQLAQDWDELAQIDPMWAICSDPKKQFGGWEKTAFFALGEVEIRRALDMAGGFGLSVQRGKALDFGCGIGRLTQALAEEFEVTFGVDVSPEMIEQAKSLNRFGDRCEYVVNRAEDLAIFESDCFDFVYTSNVLQHMPRCYMRKYLSEFVRVLKPEGVLIFHVPIEYLWPEKSQGGKSNCLESVSRFHPDRVIEKLKRILLGHDAYARYYRLRRFKLPTHWLYRRFGLRPNIPMYVLGKSTIYELMAQLRASIVGLVTEPTGDVLCAFFVVVKTSA